MRQDMLENIIAEAIGREDAQRAVEAIMDAYGGSNEWIPSKSVDPAKRTARNNEIRRLHRSGGADIPMLSERFGLSVSQVRRILGD